MRVGVGQGRLFDGVDLTGMDLTGNLGEFNWVGLTGVGWFDWG